MGAFKHEVETTYINEWVETGVYDLVVNLRVAREMRAEGIDIVDVHHVLRTGRVVRSDMLESRGLWNVKGETIDGVRLEVQIAVESGQCEVELLRIVWLKRSVK